MNDPLYGLPPIIRWLIWLWDNWSEGFLFGLVILGVLLFRGIALTLANVQNWWYKNHLPSDERQIIQEIDDHIETVRTDLTEKRLTAHYSEMLQLLKESNEISEEAYALIDPESEYGRGHIREIIIKLRKRNVLNQV